MRITCQFLSILCLCILAPNVAAGEAKPAPTGADAAAKPAEPDAKAATIEEAFERKISCEFVDTPIKDVFLFVQSLGKMNLIIAPAALEAGATINLKVADMRVGEVLRWVCRLANLELETKDQAAFIRTQDGPNVAADAAAFPSGAKLRLKLGNGNEIEADAAIFNSKPELLEKLVNRFLSDDKAEKK